MQIPAKDNYYPITEAYTLLNQLLGPTELHTVSVSLNQLIKCGKRIFSGKCLCHLLNVRYRYTKNRAVANLINILRS